MSVSYGLMGPSCCGMIVSCLDMKGEHSSSRTRNSRRMATLLRQRGGDVEYEGERKFCHCRMVAPWRTLSASLRAKITVHLCTIRVSQGEISIPMWMSWVNFHHLTQQVAFLIILNSLSTKLIANVWMFNIKDNIVMF